MWTLPEVVQRSEPLLTQPGGTTNISSTFHLPRAASLLARPLTSVGLEVSERLEISSSDKRRNYFNDLIANTYPFCLCIWEACGQGGLLIVNSGTHGRTVTWTHPKPLRTETPVHLCPYPSPPHLLCPPPAWGHNCGQFVLTCSKGVRWVVYGGGAACGDGTHQTEVQSSTLPLTRCKEAKDIIAKKPHKFFHCVSCASLVLLLFHV